MPCPFHELTGLYCPGCGGTRAVKYLLKGELVKSFIYHPFVIYGGITAVLWAAVAIYRKVKKRPAPDLARESAVVYAGIVIIIINWIIKNLLLVFWGIDLLAEPL